MREGRAAFDVADRVDPRDVGLELRIHLDEARIVGLDTCGAEVEAGGIRNAAESKEQMASRDLLDRKSTRLNSSHGYISYAVFCLKKKKTSAILHRPRI